MSDNGLSPERLTWMYTQMARIRESLAPIVQA